MPDLAALEAAASKVAGRRPDEIWAPDLWAFVGVLVTLETHARPWVDSLSDDEWFAFYAALKSPLAAFTSPCRH